LPLITHALFCFFRFHPTSPSLWVRAPAVAPVWSPSMSLSLAVAGVGRTDRNHQCEVLRSPISRRGSTPRASPSRWSSKAARRGSRRRTDPEGGRGGMKTKETKKGVRNKRQVAVYKGSSSLRFYAFVVNFHGSCVISMAFVLGTI